MQTLLAECLDMERGRSKELTGKEHLERADFILAKQRQEAEQQKAVGAWLCDYAEHRQPFDEIKHRHTLNEVGDVAEGRYDWRIEKGRGLSME